MRFKDSLRDFAEKVAKTFNNFTKNASKMMTNSKKTKEEEILTKIENARTAIKKEINAFHQKITNLEDRVYKSTLNDVVVIQPKNTVAKPHTIGERSEATFSYYDGIPTTLYCVKKPKELADDYLRLAAQGAITPIPFFNQDTGVVENKYNQWLDLDTGTETNGIISGAKVVNNATKTHVRNSDGFSCINSAGIGETINVKTLSEHFHLSSDSLSFDHYDTGNATDSNGYKEISIFVKKVLKDTKGNTYDIEKLKLTPSGIFTIKGEVYGQVSDGFINYKLSSAFTAPSADDSYSSDEYLKCTLSVKIIQETYSDIDEEENFLITLKINNVVIDNLTFAVVRDGISVDFGVKIDDSGNIVEKITQVQKTDEDGNITQEAISGYENFFQEIINTTGDDDDDEEYDEVDDVDTTCYWLRESATDGVETISSDGWSNKSVKIYIKSSCAKKLTYKLVRFSTNTEADETATSDATPVTTTYSGSQLVQVTKNGEAISGLYELSITPEIYANTNVYSQDCGFFMLYAETNPTTSAVVSKNDSGENLQVSSPIVFKYIIERKVDTVKNPKGTEYKCAKSNVVLNNFYSDGYGRFIIIPDEDENGNKTETPNVITSGFDFKVKLDSTKFENNKPVPGSYSSTSASILKAFFGVRKFSYAYYLQRNRKTNSKAGKIELYVFSQLTGLIPQDNEVKVIDATKTAIDNLLLSQETESTIEVNKDSKEKAVKLVVNDVSDSGDNGALAFRTQWYNPKNEAGAKVNGSAFNTTAGLSNMSVGLFMPFYLFSENIGFTVSGTSVETANGQITTCSFPGIGVDFSTSIATTTGKKRVALLKYIPTNTTLNWISKNIDNTSGNTDDTSGDTGDKGTLYYSNEDIKIVINDKFDPEINNFCILKYFNYHYVPENLTGFVFENGLSEFDYTAKPQKFIHKSSVLNITKSSEIDTSKKTQDLGTYEIGKLSIPADSSDQDSLFYLNATCFLNNFTVFSGMQATVAGAIGLDMSIMNVDSDVNFYLSKTGQQDKLIGTLNIKSNYYNETPSTFHLISTSYRTSRSSFGRYKIYYTTKMAGTSSPFIWKIGEGKPFKSEDVLAIGVLNSDIKKYGTKENDLYSISVKITQSYTGINNILSTIILKVYERAN